MPEQPLTQVPQGWDGAVAHYEATAEQFTGRYVERVLSEANVSPGTALLDAAAGAGAVTIAAARRGADVLAVDFSPKMVERLQARVVSEGLTNVQAQVGDCQALDLPDASRDIVACNFGALFFPDPVAGFREMYRILRPGGTAVITTWSPWEDQGLIQTVGAALQVVAPDLQSPPEPETDKPDLAKPDAFAAALRDAAFSDIRVNQVHETWSPTSLDAIAFFQGVIASNPGFADLLALLTSEQAQALPIEAAHKLHELFGDPPSLPMQANLAVARKR